MAMNTSSSGAVLTPAQVDELLIRPVLAESVAAQVAKVIHTNASALRLPVVAADPTAAWTAEGAEIAVSDATLEEVNVAFHALKGLTVVSNELIEDSSPEASQLVGEGLARDVAKRLDAAYFGVSAANTPNGIGSVSGVQSVTFAGPWANLDPFHEALSLAETVGATVSAFVTSPAVALALAKIKTGTGSNTPLLGQDPTSPTKRTIAGVPLFVSSAVAANIVWAIPFQRTVIGLRKDVDVATDTSAFFTSDRTAVRAVLRAGFGFAHAAAIVKVTATP
ncbi:MULTISPECIES: phage major capsid protein [unclassified Rhodococcus (in: high G+C Gram-positive bacteria)]|uniref:phage major capsid protein n=1 Tax=unclassified Rhodococcus (in: high G+C Gram-positive bacteria) TaxID=192944 RepID=UPI002078D4ED|nr:MULTISPECIES: phage major capsid protein [unclassified Rhodococcus (in: high G+C Gram-positive bacteria)]